MLLMSLELNTEYYPNAIQAGNCRTLPNGQRTIRGAQCVIRKQPRRCRMNMRRSAKLAVLLSKSWRCWVPWELAELTVFQGSPRGNAAIIWGGLTLSSCTCSSLASHGMSQPGWTPQPIANFSSISCQKYTNFTTDCFKTKSIISKSRTIQFINNI